MKELKYVSKRADDIMYTIGDEYSGCVALVYFFLMGSIFIVFMCLLAYVVLGGQ